jgi:hypothetical protein
LVRRSGWVALTQCASLGQGSHCSLYVWLPICIFALYPCSTRHYRQSLYVVQAVCWQHPYPINSRVRSRALSVWWIQCLISCYFVAICSGIKLDIIQYCNQPLSLPMHTLALQQPLFSQRQTSCYYYYKNPTTIINNYCSFIAFTNCRNTTLSDVRSLLSSL